MEVYHFLKNKENGDTDFLDHDFRVFNRERMSKARPLPELNLNGNHQNGVVNGLNGTKGFHQLATLKLVQAKWTTKLRSNYKDICTILFKTVKMKEQVAIAKMNKCREELKELNISLYDKRACDAVTGKTILHVAIEMRKWLFVKALTEHDQDFLLCRKTYAVNINGIHSHRSCLFILVEKHGRIKQCSKPGIISFTCQLLQNMEAWSSLSEENKLGYSKFIEEPSAFVSKIAGTGELSPLHIACYYGDIIMAELLLKHHANPDVTNSQGETPLMWATLCPEPQSLVRMLIRHGASTDTIANDGSMAIHWAILANDVGLVLCILGKRNREEVINKERMAGFHFPLIQASACGFNDVVKCLLTLGADIMVANRGGQTAFHYAAAAGNTDILRVLKSYLPDSVDVEDKLGNTPLMFAVKGDHVVTAQFLLEQGADIYKGSQLGDTVWSLGINQDNNKMLKKLVDAHRTKLSPDGSAVSSPLQVATVLNNIDKLKFLLQFVDRSETDCKYGNTFVHVAAKLNYMKLLKQTLEVEDPLIHARNLNQDTPLHLATKNGHVELVEMLLSVSGLSGPVNTHEKLIRVPRGLRGTPLHASAVAKTPQMAKLFLSAILGSTDENGNASSGDSDNYVSSMVDDVDEQQNTCLHLSITRQDSEHLVKQLVKHTKNINRQNFEGNTALHLAAYHGNDYGVETMLSSQHTKLGTRNIMDRTALHMAVRASKSKLSLNVINMLITAIRHVDEEMLYYKDYQGDTALHIACRMDRIEVVSVLVKHGLSPKTINNDGNNPLHVAMFKSRKCFRKALELFQGLNLDQKNFNEETVLDIYARKGLKDHMRELIVSGADLSHTNIRKETMLHSLIRQSVLEPEKLAEYREVFAVMCEVAPHWWCLKHDCEQPQSYHAAKHLKLYVIHYLTSYLKDEVGLSVLNLAVSIGAKDMVHTILNTPDVFCTKESLDGRLIVSYDITGLGPSCMVNDKDFRHGSQESRPRGKKVETKKKTVVAIEDVTCLDVVADMRDIGTAVDIMKISPITETVDHYWRAFQWLTLRLMVFHVAYMVTFSLLVYPTLMPGYHNVTVTGSHTERRTIHDYAFAAFIPWPFILFIVFLCYNTVHLPKFSTKWKAISWKSAKTLDTTDMSAHIKIIFYWLYDSLPLIASCIFPILICCWYGLHLIGSKYEVYIATTVILLGWLMGIPFTLGVKGVHTFCEMFRYIMIRDVARFLCIYLFVLCSVLFSLHAMFQVVPEFRVQFVSAWDTLFLLFNVMVGVGELFNRDSDKHFEDAGFNSMYPKLIYVFYVVLSMIIMVNLLIAMVNDTYESVKTREGTAWRKSTVMFAVRIERKLPWVKRFFKHRLVGCLKDYAKPSTICVTLKCNQGHLKTITYNRYIMEVMKDSRRNVPESADEEDRKDVADSEAMHDYVETLEKKLEENRAGMQQMSKDMAVIKEMVAKIWLQQSLAGTTTCAPSNNFNPVPASEELEIRKRTVRKSLPSVYLTADLNEAL